MTIDEWIYHRYLATHWQMPFKDSLCIVDSPYLLQPQQMVKWIVPMRSIWEGRRLVLLSFFCALCVTFQRERDSHQWWSRYCCRVHCAAAPTLIASWRLRPVSVIAVCAYNCLYPHITNSFLYSPVLPPSLSLSLSPLIHLVRSSILTEIRMLCKTKQQTSSCCI